MTTPNGNRYTEVGEAVDFITGVFTGSDGGVAFGMFRHGFLPYLAQDKSAGADEIRKIILRFANLVQATLKEPE